jgi:ABC-type branched-subunit amino acid transport system substrate-binding protein
VIEEERAPGVDAPAGSLREPARASRASRGDARNGCCRDGPILGDQAVRDSYVRAGTSARRRQNLDAASERGRGDVRGAARFVLRGGSEEYVDDIAPWFAPAARELGLTVAGTFMWDPGARNAAGIAAKVKQSGADAVYLAGLLFDGRVAGQIIDDLRAQLPRVPLIAGDGFTPISLLFDSAGRAAKGIYVSTIGLDPSRLPVAGRRFLRTFAATQPNGRIDPRTAYWVAYAAAATETLLDAIARSDGTRTSVTRALFRTHLRNGIVGDMAFDRNGDATTRPITIYRARKPGGSIQFEAVQGATLVRVISVPPDLFNETR